MVSIILIFILFHYTLNFNLNYNNQKKYLKTYTSLIKNMKDIWKKNYVKIGLR